MEISHFELFRNQDESVILKFYIYHLRLISVETFLEEFVYILIFIQAKEISSLGS